MAVPTVAVVGLSDSGKTRVVTALVQYLIARGYRVAAIKHAPHGHEPSPSGKDSDRLYAAGAEKVVVSSPGLVTTVSRGAGDASLDDLVAALDPRPDVVIAEGFKTDIAPKVLVQGDGELTPVPSNVVAGVGDVQASSDWPTFGMDRLEELGAYLEGLLLSQADGEASSGKPRVYLAVDGREVPLKEYPAIALNETLRGFLRSLKGVPSEPGTIEVRLSDD